MAEVPLTKGDYYLAVLSDKPPEAENEDGESAFAPFEFGLDVVRYDSTNADPDSMLDNLDEMKEDVDAHTASAFQMCNLMEIPNSLN